MLALLANLEANYDRNRYKKNGKTSVVTRNVLEFHFCAGRLHVVKKDKKNIVPLCIDVRMQSNAQELQSVD